ncbi:mineralocorticoid receptor [Paramormyrops kingsleyae]|uniref:mineralocorticoid receptor n=1 Tax=Paramormyrops kingsleyae TaxID=1676925 RepID=UPI003B971F24
METKRYHSLFEGPDAQCRWVQGPNEADYCDAAKRGFQARTGALMDPANASRPSVPELGFKEGGRDKMDHSVLCPSQNQQFVFPSFSGSAAGTKLEMDSKELSKTVAESMGLYMNAAREVDYGIAQQPSQTGHCSPSSLCPAGGQHHENNLDLSTKSPKLKSPPSSYHGAPHPANVLSVDCASGALPGSGALAGTLSGSPANSNNSAASPASNAMVSSTTSPTYFGSTCPTLNSPISQSGATPGLAAIHPRNPTACSPANTASMGSPHSSPPNIMRSPISSPQSMSSVKSPLSCGATVRSSVSSPAGNNTASSNMRASLSSPGSVGAMALSSPRNLPGFPVSSPAGGLGLVQSDIHSPVERDQDLKGFEFPKVECVEEELYNVGLDQMDMVKFIKNEPDTNFRSMCLGSSKGSTTNSTFPIQVKTEPNKEMTCLNPHYHNQESSLNLYSTTETTYLSLRDNMDEYSLSGILGPPISSLNGNYEPGVFPNSVLPKGIKQECNDGSYYQDSNTIQTPAVVGVNSGGHSFHYQIGAQGTMSFSRHDIRDQTNPLLNLISPVTALMETWKARRGLSQNSLSSRGEGYPGQGCIAENMSSSSLRHSSLGSSTAKVCLVCGDEASGCHYGVVTCGSCKVFFKRAVEGQHNYLCAGRNDCIIDKIRRKNCPACRVRKCLQAGMNLGARKSKKLGKMKGVSEEPLPSLQSPKEGQKEVGHGGALVPHTPGVTPYLSPSICSVLELIEPEVVYAGYDNTQPDTTDHLLSSLNQLAGKQMIRVVKWAKVLPGFRSLPIEDQITLIQYSWMCLSSFALSWRSYKHTNGQMLYFAPDLIFNEERMQQSAMYDLCLGMRQVSQDFMRLQLTYDEYLAMKVLLLLSTVPKDGLKNQAAFEEMRVNYIKELRRSVGKATNNSGQTWQRFFQLTKLLDAMHDLVGNLLDFCFYTFRESQALKVEFPDMLVEIISDQISKVESGLTHTLYFHKK